MQFEFSKILSVETLFNGWNRFHRVTAEFIDHAKAEKQSVTHSVEDHGDGVGILPFDADLGIVLLVKQARLPLAFAGKNADSLESPAGGCDGNMPDVAARRELEEEVGITDCELIAIGAGHPMPGISTELTHLFLAVFNAIRNPGKGGGLVEEGEHIEVVRFAIKDLIPAIQSGQIACLRTIALTYALKDRRPELFI